MQNDGTSLQFKHVQLPGTNISLLCDASTPTARSFITRSFRKIVFNSLHQLSHPGARATAKLVSDRYVWPRVQADCKTWTRACVHCQRAKISRHVSTPVSHFISPTSRFGHVHMDIVGPLPSSQGYNYCLTCVDRFSRWPEAIPVENIEATTVAKAFLSGWVARFGPPLRITTDQGRQFESHLFRELNMLLGSQHLRTTAFHPAANGLVERMHRQLKTAIKCHATEKWTEVLPIVLLGMRSAWREDQQASAAELLYGETLRLPGEFLSPCQSNTTNGSSEFVQNLREYFKELQPVKGTRHGSGKIFIFKDLPTAEQVFVKRGMPSKSLEPTYNGPYPVIQRSDKTFVVNVKGKNVTVSIDRLKPTYMLQEEKQLEDSLTKEGQQKDESNCNKQQPKTDDKVNDSSEGRKTRSGRRVRFPDYLQSGFS